MALSGFFDSIHVNIKFTEEHCHKRFNILFDHFKHEYNVDIEDVIVALKSSHEFETNEKMNKETYEHILNEENNIERIYRIIEPKLPCKRNKMVYINDSFGTVYKGAKQSYINIPRLQIWVNKYHDYEFENKVDGMLAGFILYLLYVRIHPHFDGNGRMSRYLFLENKLNNINFCPLSKILNERLLPTKYMNEIYEYVDASINPDNVKEEDYYHLKIDNKLLMKIYYVIYISVCYGYCLKLDAELIKLINDIDDFKHIFCLGKVLRNVGDTLTTIKISNERRQRVNKFVERINELLDFETHKEIINGLGIV